MDSPVDTVEERIRRCCYNASGIVGEDDMDPKTVEKLEEKVEEAVVEVIVKLGLKKLRLFRPDTRSRRWRKRCR